MDILEEILYLSSKGYEFMENGNFNAAKTYFMDAVSIVLTKKEAVQAPHKRKFEELASSLLKLAQDAHTLNFSQIKNNHIYLQNYQQTINLKKKPIPKVKKISRKKRKKNSTDSKLSIKLGTTIEENSLVKWMPNDLMNGIVTITGGSGSGKTECIKLLATELIKNEIPCIIIDLHGDIELPIETISLDYLAKHSINPFELTSKSEIDGGPVPHVNRLMTQFSYAIQDRFSATQKSWLRTLLKFAYYSHGFRQEDITTWNNNAPTFKYLLDLIKNPDEIILASKQQEFIRILDAINKSSKIAVENRISPILEHPAFSGNNTLSLDDLITKPHRILLKPLNTIDMQFLAADTIMRQVFAYIKSKGHIDKNDLDNKFRLFIIIDEVKILTGYRGSLNDPYHILNRFATEARKFGLGLILASQILGHFGRDIRSNSATKLILKTMDQDEAKRCSKELKIQLHELFSLNRPGEGFLITSRNKTAKHIQLFPV